MSYCRFQNTLIDFRDCIEAIESGSDLSDDEAEAANELAALAARLVRLMTTISEHGADGSVIQRDPHPVHGGGISREECEARARVIAEALNAAGLV